MKAQKFTLSAITACFLLGVSGTAAMATGCGDGVLKDETFDGSLVVDSESSCAIISSTVQGDILVTNSDNVLLLNNKVGGKIRIETLTGDFKINRNVEAFVQKNISGRNFTCNNNTAIESFLNFAAKSFQGQCGPQFR